MDIVEDHLETATKWEVNQLDAARQFVNSALRFVDNAVRMRVVRDPDREASLREAGYQVGGETS